MSDVRPMTQGEWDWIESNPSDADGKFIRTMMAMSASRWSHVEAALTEAAIMSLRRTMAKEAANA